MLMTSSTDSAEPRKGVVGVGGGGRYRVEPVGKHEIDGIDDDDSRIDDFDRKFYPRLQYGSYAIHLNAQDKFINRFIN